MRKETLAPIILLLLSLLSSRALAESQQKFREAPLQVAPRLPTHNSHRLLWCPMGAEESSPENQSVKPRVIPVPGAADLSKQAIETLLARCYRNLRRFEQDGRARFLTADERLLLKKLTRAMQSTLKGTSSKRSLLGIFLQVKDLLERLRIAQMTRD